MIWLVGIVGGGALLAKSGKASAAEAKPEEVKSTLPTSDQVATVATEVAKDNLATAGVTSNSPVGTNIVDTVAVAASKVMTSDMLINMTVNGVTDDTRIAAVRIPATFRKATTPMTTQQATAAQTEQQAQNNDWASIISSATAASAQVYAMQQKQEAKIAALVSSPYSNYGYVYDPPLDKLPDLPSTKSTYTYRWEFVPLKTEYSGKWVPQPVYVQKTVQPVSTPLVDATKPQILPQIVTVYPYSSMVPAGPQPEPVPGVHRVTNRLSDRESSYFKQTQMIEDIYLPAKPAVSSVTQEWYFQNDGITASGEGVWIVTKQQVNY
jgi:hypothetical protein